MNKPTKITPLDGHEDQQDRKPAKAERIAKAKKEATAAKRAGGTNIKATGALPAGAAKAKSVDDFIGALVDDRMTAET